MISYEPFWKTINERKITTYQLIYKQGILPDTIQRLRSGKTIRFAGNTAQGATKPATVETGAQVQVPLFVNQGDKLKIDTRTGEYLSRV